MKLRLRHNFKNIQTHIHTLWNIIAKVLGIKVVQIDEAYTSQTCPRCGNRKKPTNRNYTCACGLKYHRDGVGAINIRQKYLGHFGIPVVADMDLRTMKMTPPLGFRLKVPVALS